MLPSALINLFPTPTAALAHDGTPSHTASSDNELLLLDILKALSIGVRTPEPFSDGNEF